MSTRLPIEIVEQILRSIEDKSTLENLFRVAKPNTQRLIATILYAEITIFTSPGVANPPAGAFEGLHIHQLLIHDYPWLASYVEQLILVVCLAPPSDVQATLYVTEVLPLLINLKRFSFSDGSNRAAKDVLADHVHPYLTHFSCETTISSAHWHPDAFARFLASQPHLEHLTVHDDTPALNLPAESLQKLRYLHSHLPFAISILCGRRVTDLSVLGMSGVYFQWAAAGQQLDEAFRHVRTLQTRSIDKEVWAQLVRRFVALEFLHVHAPLRHIITNSMLVALKPAKLRYIRIASSQYIFDQEESLIPLAFELLPSLQVIDFQIEYEKQKFTRVRRDSAATRGVVRLVGAPWKPWWYGCQLEPPGYA